MGKTQMDRYLADLKQHAAAMRAALDEIEKLTAEAKHAAAVRHVDDVLQPQIEGLVSASRMVALEHGYATTNHAWKQAPNDDAQGVA